MDLDFCKRPIRCRRGASLAYVWSLVIMNLFAVAIIFIPLDNAVRNTIYHIGVDLGADVQLLDIVMYTWTILPFLLTAAYILFGIVYTIRRGGEGDYSRY